MRTILILTFSLFLFVSATAQYNPLWIRHCRAIPKSSEDYSKLAELLDGKIKRQSADAEMDFLLGICLLGSNQNDKAADIFNQITNNSSAKASIKADALNYQQYLRKISSGQKMEIVVNYTNTMKAPDEKAPLRGRVYQGDQFVVTKEEGNWAYIINKENQGWILKSKDGSEIAKAI